MSIRVGIITISDRSARGEREDESGPAIVDVVLQQGWQVVRTNTIPDDLEAIKSILVEWSDMDFLDIILTTGGTGFSPRDVTPEATAAVIQRPAFGIVEAMRAAGLRLTPHAMLSRATAGIREKTLIINLPGSPKAALENLSVVLPVLPHAVQLLSGNPSAETGHLKI
jgi:molybdenum cofactor synthesis domain-containing protein